MKVWNPITETYDDEGLEQHDTYLRDLHTDFAATAKSNANSGAPGKSMMANFSQPMRKVAKERKVKLRAGAMMEEARPGNDFFNSLLP